MKRVSSFILCLFLFLGSGNLVHAMGMKQLLFGPLFPEKRVPDEIIGIGMTKDELATEFKTVSKECFADGQYLLEAIPPSESLKNWSKMLTFQYMPIQYLQSGHVPEVLQLLY